MNHSLWKRVDVLAEQIGVGCPACRDLQPVIVFVRQGAESSDSSRCPACGRERATMVIEIRRVDRADRSPV